MTPLGVTPATDAAAPATPVVVAIPPKPSAGALSAPLAAQAQRALRLHRNGQLAEARALYEAVLAEHPTHRDTLHLLGSLLRQMGESEQALVLVEQAITVGPADGPAFNNRGNILFDLRRYDAALASFDQAVALAPQLADSHNGRGNTLRALRRLPEALASFDQALALRPDFAEVHNNRANVLRDMQRYDEALQGYDAALRLKPQLAETYNNRANTHKAAKRFPEAAQDYGRALAARPQYPYALGLQLHCQMLNCDWTDFDALTGRLAKALANDERAAPLLPVLSIFDSPPMHQRVARSWMRVQHPPNAALGPVPQRAPGGRIRVGYLSGDFYSHPVGYLTTGLFEAHDRQRFELFALSSGKPSEDPVRARLRAAFDHFIDIDGLSDLEAARAVRSLELDIVIDLGGYTQGSRIGVLAYRVAPIQASFLGYPGTSGAPFIDYLIADRFVIPDAMRPFYDERLALLPWFQPNDSTRVIADTVFERAAFGLPNEGVVFCCFNTHYKIGPKTFAGWLRILNAVPDSVLWLRDNGPLLAANLRRAAHAAGVAPERIVLAPVLPSNADHLARHRLADLFLDTLPYNAHTTAADALWAGVPVLTCAGRSYAARVGASLLQAVGLPELITESQADYEALAIALAHDRARLRALRTRLQEQRPTAALFDPLRHTRYLEAALDAMYRRQHAGLAPADLHVA